MLACQSAQQRLQQACEGHGWLEGALGWLTPKAAAMQSPNILLDKDWNAKISDTGLARTLFTDTHLSNTSPGGTFAWQVSTHCRHVMVGRQRRQYPACCSCPSAQDASR